MKRTFNIQRATLNVQLSGRLNVERYPVHGPNARQSVHA